MSIDARIESVRLNEDGSGELRLIDRPASSGGVPGISGQRSLRFEKAPEEVTALNGLDIWGGSDSVVLGEVEIAKRKGYTGIEFHDAKTFKKAIESVRRK